MGKLEVRVRMVLASGCSRKRNQCKQVCGGGKNWMHVKTRRPLPGEKVHWGEPWALRMKGMLRQSVEDCDWQMWMERQWRTSDDFKIKDRIREEPLVVNLDMELECSKGERKKVEVGRLVRKWGKGSWNEKERVIEGHASVTQKLIGNMSHQGWGILQSQIWRLNNWENGGSIKKSRPGKDSDLWPS